MAPACFCRPGTLQRIHRTPLGNFGEKYPLPTHTKQTFC